MSNFDPEKVADVSPHVFNQYNQSYRAVGRVDFDELLKLYREAVIVCDWLAWHWNAARGDLPEDWKAPIREGSPLGPHQRRTRSIYF